MEDDLRAQEEFYRSGEKPAASVVRANTPNKDKSNSIPENAFHSILSPVKEIKEHTVVREKVILEGKANSSGFPTAEKINTQFRRGGKKSLFKQSMEQKTKQKTVQSKAWSEEEETKLKRSLNCEVKTEDLQRDVTSILNQMSPEEIQEAQKELLSTLDPSLIQFLQKRSAYKDSLNGNVKEEKNNESDTKMDQMDLQAKQTKQARQSTQIKPNKSIQINSKPTKQDIENEQRLGQEIANSLDYTKIQTEEDLAAAVSLLPSSEQQKLAWTKPVHISKETKDLRFHFDGYIIPSTSSYDIQSGLYNHGEEGDKAGYTISELILLGRSAVSGQRVLALKCILNILHKRLEVIQNNQELKPALLPVDLLHLLLFILQRKAGIEETFLAIQCLEACCSSQAECYRQLVLNLSYHGYQHAHLTEVALLAYAPNEDDEDEEEKEEDKQNPFRRENCKNLFSILYECDLVTMLFHLLELYSTSPSIVNHCFNLLRILIENDKRFSDTIVNSTALFMQLEKFSQTYFSLSILPNQAYQPQPSSTDLSLRLFYIQHHSQASFTSSIFALLFLEAFCRHNKRNAMNILRSKVFSVLKEWLLFFSEDQSSYFLNNEVNAMVEGVLSIWRLLLNYGLDEEGIDPFLPQLIRLSQFSCISNRILVWEIFEVSILHKKDVSADYFIDFNNSIILLIIECLKSKPSIFLEASMIHYFATYIEVINDSLETWLANNLSDSLLQSIQTQIIQLGYGMLESFQSLPSSLIHLHHTIISHWNDLIHKPTILLETKPVGFEEGFTTTEFDFLVQSNTMYALSRLIIGGIQNSRQFVGMLRESGWIDLLMDFVKKDFWKEVQQNPHSITYTYLPRLFILSQVNSILALHAILPFEKENPQSNHACIWRQSWNIIQSILPGDEYIALELLLHVLLDPACIKVYLEHHNEEGSVNFDLDCLTSLLIQQLGEGKLIEHSQALHCNEYSSRLSLRLLPYPISPSLPLLSYWYCLPFYKLRFRSIGSTVQNPFTVSTELQAYTLLYFLKEIEEGLVDEQDCAMRYYCYIHMIFGGNEIVTSERVQELFNQVIQANLHWKKQVNSCSQHPSMISEMEQIIPKKEILDYLNKVCCFITDEYYYNDFVFRFLLSFLTPCRDWNYRVLILNYFLDNNYASLLITADSKQVLPVSLEKMSDEEVEEIVKQIWSSYQNTNTCWETSEEMVEMYLRFFEQASYHSKKMKYYCVCSNLYFTLLHYISNKYPRYLYYYKQLSTLFPFIHLETLF